MAAADATIQGLRSVLEHERDHLRHELADLRPGIFGQTYDPNFADSSQVTAERGETEALVGQLSESLRQIEHALDKFDSDSYGVCENCGKPIAPARLEARPEAQHCIDCAAIRR
jgi:DnaK suppressor protein